MNLILAIELSFRMSWYNSINASIAIIILQVKMAHNGRGFAQDGHSYTVAGLAGHRLGGLSLMSLRPNY